LNRYQSKKFITFILMFPPFIEMPLTYVFSGLIILLSIIGFYYKPLYNKLVYHPFEVFRGNRIHTLFTSIFLHKNWMHLLFNIYLLYIMSKDIEYIILEKNYSQVQIKLIWFFVLAFGTVSVNLVTGWIYRKDVSHTTIGASGIAFAFTAFSILYLPLDHLKRKHKFIPLYYGYEIFLAFLIIFVCLMFIYRKNSKSNHKAHFFGLIIGSLLAIVFRPTLITEIIYHLKSRW